MEESIRYSVEEETAWITLNQPQKANRLNYNIMLELVGLVNRADQDDGVKVIVITGAGDKAFCAGAAIDEFEHKSILASKRHLDAYAGICRVFNSVFKPSIAMINGYAMGGGCGLAMLPHFSIACEDAVFSCPEINVGIWPMMVTAILFRTVGRKKGLEFICRGTSISAEEAQRIGMINKAVPRDELHAYVLRLCDELKSKSSSTMRLGLEAFHSTADMEYARAVNYLRDMSVIVTNTEDAKEGTSAFLEKRKPMWRDTEEVTANER